MQSILQPLSRSGLRDQVTNHLFEAIIRGQLQPGERIVEGRLARALGVAQGTLREALQVLEHQGLVTKEEHRGSYVSRLTSKEIEDIYTVRKALEPLAASLAKERMRPEDFAQVEAVVNQMERAGKARDYCELLKADLEFHRLIWRKSGNKSIERALNVVCTPLFGCYLILTGSREPYNRAKDLEEHRALLDALRNKSPDEVYRAFQQILEAFRADELENLRVLEDSGKPENRRPPKLARATRSSRRK